LEKKEPMMKKILCSLCVGLLMTGVVPATVIYQDNFDNDGLGVNTNGVGGGMTSRSLRGGTGYNWDDDGNMQYSTSATHYLNRAIAQTDTGFQSTGGFTLTVDYVWTSNLGASHLGFGLVSDMDFSSYDGYNPFWTDSSVYSFGVKSDVGLAFQNGTDLTGSTDVTQLSAGSLGTSDSAKTVMMSITPDGLGGANWSWSLDSVDQGSGTIAAFDFTKTFHFVAYGQDDQGNKYISSVVLDAIPEPAAIGLLALGGLTTLLISRMKRRS
jgi:hypothetical protein